MQSNKRARRLALRAALLCVLSALCASALPAVAAAATGSISGVVKEGEPRFEAIAGAEVCAYEATTETKRGCASTDSNGEYKIEALAETSYKVRFTASSFVTKWYNEKSSFSTADPVEVNSSTPASSEKIDALLLEEAAFGSVTGRVTNTSGQGAGGVEVCAREGGPCAETNGNGEYALAKVHNGLETLDFNPAQACEEEQGEKTNRCNLKSNYLGGQSILVRVRANETVSANTVSMQSGGQISGIVTNASITHPGLAKVRICATKTEGTTHEYEEYGEEGCAVTNSSGQYTISGLQSGAYKVEFDGEICLIPQAKKRECSETYVTRYYHGKASHRQAETIAVTTGSNTGGINESLYEGFPTTPAGVAAPTLTGNALVGQTLSCSQGTWSHEPTFLLYQWLRNGTIISGQTGTTYTLQTADLGTSITCSVTAGNGAGATIATSNAVAVPKPLAIAAGTATVKGNVAMLKLTCTGAAACTSTLKLVARVRHGKRMTNITVGTKRFSIAVGKSATIRIPLTARGRSLLGKAGKRGLKVKLGGTGVKARALVLKPAKPAKHKKK